MMRKIKGSKFVRKREKEFFLSERMGNKPERR